MFSGLILEFKYLLFRMDKWIEKNWLFLKNKGQSKCLKIWINILNLILSILPRFLLVVYFIIVSIWYLCVYSLFGFMVVVLTFLFIYTDTSISNQIIAVIVSLIGIASVIITSIQSRKQHVDAERIKAYEALIKYLIESIKSFIEKNPMRLNDEINKYITFSSNKVMCMIIEISSKSKLLNETSKEEEIDDLIDRSLFLINFMRYEISINRDIVLSQTNYTHSKLKEFLCFDYYESQRKKYMQEIEEKKKSKLERKALNNKNKIEIRTLKNKNKKSSVKIEKIIQDVADAENLNTNE